MSVLALKALIFVLAAVALAAFARPGYPGDRVSVRILSYWAIGGVIAFLSPTDALELIALGIVLAILTPPNVEDRPAFFLCVLIALPHNVYWQVPFPGINFLFRLDHALLVCFVVGLPMIFAPRSKEVAQAPLNPAITAVFVFVALWISVLNMRDTSITDALRSFFITLSVTLIPYLALARHLASRAAIRSLVVGATTVGAIIAFLGVATLFTNWNHYEHAGHNVGFGSTAVRGGVKRINLTMMHTLAGIFFSAGFVIFWFAARHAPKIKVMAYPLLFLSFIGVLGTQSRGALLAFIVMLGMLMVLRIRSMPIRLSLAGAAVIGCTMLFLALKASGFESVDAHGTFGYRDRLLDAGLEYIWVHPIAGSKNFGEAAHFADLVQGQGIVDFVNGFLQYALRWGLVGLGLFAYLWGATLWGSVRALDRFGDNGPDDVMYKAFGLGFVAVYGSLLFSFGTTSDESYYPMLLVSFIAIGQAYGRASKVPLPRREEDIATTDDPATTLKPNSPPTPEPPQAAPRLPERRSNSVWA